MITSESPVKFGLRMRFEASDTFLATTAESNTCSLSSETPDIFGRAG